MAKYQQINAGGLLRHMQRPRFVILIGLPACGKSTLAKQLVEHGYERFNADLIREELYGDENVFGDTNEIFALLYARLEEALARGSKVVIDNTSITRPRRRRYIELARKFGYQVELVLFDVSLETCLQRNEQRQRQVARGVMVSMLYSLRHSGLPARREGHLTVVRTGDPGMYSVVPVGKVRIMGRLPRARAAVRRLAINQITTYPMNR